MVDMHKKMFSSPGAKDRQGEEDDELLEGEEEGRGREIVEKPDMLVSFNFEISKSESI